VAHSLSSAANDHDDAHGDHDDIHDVGLTEWIAWSPFLIAIVVFGVYPQLMFKIFDPAVNQMLDTMKVSLGK
jgi:NADH-quinone oxidoreductase subunit M